MRGQPARRDQGCEAAPAVLHARRRHASLVVVIPTSPAGTFLDTTPLFIAREHRLVLALRCALGLASPVVPHRAGAAPHCAPHIRARAAPAPKPPSTDAA